MDLQLATRSTGAYLVVQVSGEVDIATTDQLRVYLFDSLRHRGARLIVDLSRVTFMDCGGAGMLLTAQREARRLGGEIRLAAPQSGVCKLLALTELYRALPPFPTVMAAAQAATTGIPDIPEI